MMNFNKFSNILLKEDNQSANISKILLKDNHSQIWISMKAMTMKFNYKKNSTQIILNKHQPKNQ